MRATLALLAAVTLGLALLGWGAWRASQTPTSAAYGASVTEALSGTAGTEGFARALTPRPFVFPADAGPHPEFQTEWWYYTGNLDAPDGGHYGYQLTVFRRALTARPVARTSPWGASQVYFAHFALTDAARATFRSDERWSRGAAGLAGAKAQARGGPAAFDAWVDGWSVKVEDGTVRLRARIDGSAANRRTGAAATGGCAIDLRLVPQREAALHGDRGLSHKSVDPTNASYYYSVSRLDTSGTVTVEGQTVAVRGLSWLDREWSTSALSKEEVGWDWFSLQLSDGRDIMLYRMRRRDGGLDPNSSGSLITETGLRPLQLRDVDVEAGGTWKSPRSGAVYPSSWRIRIPSEQLDLQVEPWAADQELGGAFVYWEGAVRVRSQDGRLTGNGYVELTGYAQPPTNR